MGSVTSSNSNLLSRYRSVSRNQIWLRLGIFPIITGKCENNPDLANINTFLYSPSLALSLPPFVSLPLSLSVSLSVSFSLFLSHCLSNCLSLLLSLSMSLYLSVSFSIHLITSSPLPPSICFFIFLLLFRYIPLSISLRQHSAVHTLSPFHPFSYLCFTFVCMCVYEYVCVYMCMCTYMCMCVCSSQVAFIPQILPTGYFQL